jgi:hypothetical protein
MVVVLHIVVVFAHLKLPHKSNLTNGLAYASPFLFLKGVA